MTDKALEEGILGIDAGGTFTDLAFISGVDSTVEVTAKTPTLHHDLLTTIESGLKLVLEQVDPKRIKGVNLATTLATNAIVEGQIRPVGLILIGYDRVQVNNCIAANKFGTQKVLMIDGGHDPKGNEAAPLDIDTLEANIDKILTDSESVAISGYFSVRNPSHEEQVKQIVKKHAPNMYVTCGHELASDLDAILRATTATLNAGLIPIVMDLFHSVQEIFAKYNINVPVSIVRSDGSLVCVDWAIEHPIETVLSGPAASAIGACHLAKARNFKRPTWVVDVGGTTTDIIYLDEEGKPGLGTEGTTVGGHKTLIKSIDIYTFGLGGDSRVQIDKDNNVVVRSRRVKSLCSLAHETPGVADALKRMVDTGAIYEPLVVRPGINKKARSSFEAGILEKIENSFSTPDVLLEKERLANMGYVQLEDMEQNGQVTFAGFTPTDALHVLGRLKKWHTAASEMGAHILSRGRYEIHELSQLVCDEVVKKIALNVLRKSFSRKNNISELRDFDEFLKSGLRKDISNGEAEVSFKLNAALVGVGAPSWAFIKEAGLLMGEDAHLPANAEVAGAVGAAVGAFSLRYSVWITPLITGIYRVHLPSGVVDYPDLQTAVKEAVAFMEPWIKERAKKIGASTPVIKFRQEDEEAWVQGGLRKVHLWTQLWFDVVNSDSLQSCDSI